MKEETESTLTLSIGQVCIHWLFNVDTWVQHRMIIEDGYMGTA